MDGGGGHKAADVTKASETSTNAHTCSVGVDAASAEPIATPAATQEAEPAAAPEAAVTDAPAAPAAPDVPPVPFAHTPAHSSPTDLSEKSSSSFPDTRHQADVDVEKGAGRKGGPGTPADTRDTPPDPKKKDPDLVTYDESDAHENPRSWKKSYRFFMVMVMSGYTLLSPITSAMISPALESMAHDFNVTNGTIINLMMSSQMLSMFVAPLFYAPLSEYYGRRNILQVTNIIFLILNVGCGLSQTATQMIVLRFILGLFGTAPLALGAGMVVDLFNPEERGESMAVYTLAPLMGPCLGPLFSGWIIQGWGPDKWRWIFWVSTMFGAAVAVLGLLVLRETYAPVLLARKARRLRKETGNPRLHTAFERKLPFSTHALHMVLRPGIFFCTQPVVTVPCLFQGLVFGSQFLMMTEFPRTYKAVYQQPPGIASLHYIALLLGYLLCGQGGGRLIDVIYRRLQQRNGGVGKPEFKLPLMIITGVLTPCGMLIFGWTLRYHVFWLVPDIGLFLMATGVRGAVFTATLYVADAVPVYSASATSTMVMMRGLLGFAFPLFSPQMYDRLGQGWGNSVLALTCALLGIPAPFLFFRYGEKLREHSKFSKHAMELMS